MSMIVTSDFPTGKGLDDHLAAAGSAWHNALAFAHRMKSTHAPYTHQHLYHTLLRV